MNHAGVLRSSTRARSSLFACLLVVPASTQLPSKTAAQAHEQSVFAMEGVPLSHSVDLPRSALQVMRENTFVLSCLEKGQSSEDIPGDWFVASEVHLRATQETDLLVMPRDTSESAANNACLFHAHSMPFWVLIKSKTGYTLALEEHVQALRVLSSVSNGYRDIETKLSNLNESTTWVFRFDGHRYVLKKETSTPTQ